MSVTLATPVYTLGDWQGNVTDDFGVDWVVEVEEGWSSSPPVRPTMEDRTSGDGSWAGPGFYGARIITLAGKAMAPDRVSMLWAKERLKGAAGPRSLTRLRVDEAHLSRVADVRASDQVHIADWADRSFDWSIILAAADPRRYSASPSILPAALPSASTAGRTYPRAYPLLYGGASGGTGSAFFTQQGNYDQTPATIVFSGPLISPTVAHVQSGRMLSFDTTINQGESLAVDLNAGTALLNGTVSRAYALTSASAWFMLVPGQNELQFRGQAGTSTDGTTPIMTVTASSAWK